MADDAVNPLTEPRWTRVDVIVGVDNPTVGENQDGQTKDEGSENEPPTNGDGTICRDCCKQSCGDKLTIVGSVKGGGDLTFEDIKTFPFFIDEKSQTVVFFNQSTTAFSGEGASFSDLTSTINAAVHNRLNTNSPPNRLWAVAFGGAREDGPSEADYGGVIAGFDAPVTARVRGGFLAGWSETEQREAGLHRIDADAAFIGVYGRGALGSVFADMIVTAGATGNDSRRRILNPLAPGGVEFASGDYDGYFVNPELLLGFKAQPLNGLTLLPTLSLAYAGLHLDGFSEQGSAAAISLDERDIHLLLADAQIELEKKWKEGAETWRISGKAGVKARANAGESSAKGVLAGATSFRIDLDDDTAVAGYVGGGVSYAPSPHFEIFAGGEAAAETTGASVLTGRIGGSAKF
ncbi:MAG: autotransporter outer membrane beta-barrel domain-containing protein [Hyphomicrobiales bacterium]|nr:autotransporter outer membrane beta-barrel domain-containing protein [Hyphomicrobiales bacterium]